MLEARNRMSVSREWFDLALIEDLPTQLQQQLVELAGLELVERVAIDDEITFAYYEGGEDILLLGFRGADLRYISHVVVVGGGFIYQHYSYYGNGWHVTGDVVEGSEDWKRFDDWGLESME